MSSRHSVIIVASPRSRVGKTLLARLATDFHAQEGTLGQYLPKRTTVSEISDIKGQIALFDRLIADNGVSKAVDLGHESFAGVFALAGQIGFAEEAHRRAVAPAVLFVISPDATAVETYRNLRVRFPQMLLAAVHNEVFGAAQHRDKYQLVRHAETLIQLPLLTPGLRKYIETAPFSFADAERANSRIPLEVRTELQRWLRRAWREFRELDLRLLLADFKSSIGLST